MRLALALAVLSPVATGSTYVVDVNNGPGTDFTQISAAIAAAAPGDTLLVMPGQYTTFVLDKPLAIVGQGSPSAEALFYGGVVQNLPAGSTTALVNLYQNGIGWNGLRFLSNQGAVIVDDVTTVDDLRMTSCVDVRFRRIVAQDAMFCTSSRVEIADSLVSGRPGGTCTCCLWPQTGGTGGPAIVITGGEVHLARTTAIGGPGGQALCLDIGGCDTDGGDGGAGIYVDGGRLIVSGPSSEFVQGGLGGTSICSGGFNGSPGPALILLAGSELRYSGETLVGGIVNLGGTVAQPDPADPTLFALDAPQAGTLWTLRVQAPVGSMVDVVLGRRPTIAATPVLEVGPLCPVNRIFHLGVVGANGIIGMNYPVPPTWAKGFSVVFQGVVTLPDTSVRYTNSAPAVIE